MKLAFISDTHFGFSKHKREYDSYIYAKQAFEIAKEKADVIVLPGDIFDSSGPGEDCLSKVFSLLQQFASIHSEAKVIKVEDKHEHNGHSIFDYPIISIPGTHEYKAKEDGPLEVLENAGCLICLHAGFCTIQKGNETLNIFGMKGVPEQVAKDALAKLDFKPQKGKNILILHQSFKELLPFNDDMVATLEFKNLPEGFDLYVNGHIHAHKIFDLGFGKFLLPGSTIITQVRKQEMKQKKGFVLYDTETGALEHIEIPIQREYAYIDVDVDKDITVVIDDFAKKPTQTYSIFGKDVPLEPYLKLKIIGDLEEHKKEILVLAKKREGIILDVEKDISIIEQKIKEIDFRATKESALDMAEKAFIENIYSSGFKKSFDLKVVYDYLKDGDNDKVLDYLDDKD